MINLRFSLKSQNAAQKPASAFSGTLAFVFVLPCLPKKKQEKAPCLRFHPETDAGQVARPPCRAGFILLHDFYKKKQA